MTSGRTDRASRLMAAPASKLFACWTDPALLTQWLAPRGMSAQLDVFNPVAGQLFRIVLRYEDASIAGKSGGNADVVAGQFVVIDPPRHLAFVSRFESADPTLQGEMRMDWHFDPQVEGTLVRIVASQVPPGISATDHENGMASSLAQLSRLVE